MIKKRYLVAVSAVSAALAACGSSIDAPPGAGPNTGTGGSTATTGGSSSTGGTKSTGGTGNSPGTGGSSTAGSGTGGSSAGSGGIEDLPECVPGIPATSQIPRIRNQMYDFVVRDLLGVTTLASADNGVASTLLYPDYDGPMNVDAWRLFQDAALKVATEVMGGTNRTKFIACDPAAAGCLSETIRTFGRKAFRRPLTDAEVARFERLSQTTPAGTPEEVALTTLQAFLVSPSFIQRVEAGTEVEGTAIKLTQHEMASRLSFLLWGSVPDQILMEAADNNELQTKEQILNQATRMIGDRAKTAPLVASYHREYLDMSNGDAHWWKSQHDSTKFPLYNVSMEPAFMQEIDLFFEEVAFAGGTFKDIFLSNVGYVNSSTAPIYGLPAANYTANLQRVELDAQQRPGFLTRIGFLQSYSHYEATSPILRGAYVTVNIIGVNPGAPDPNFFLTPPPEGTYYTERAFVEALTAAPTCTGCHTPYVNPPGFVLESYDAIGGWQTTDPRAVALGDPSKGTINGTADVYFTEDAPKTITSPRQMMEEIAVNQKAKEIYAQKWVRFATGRSANPNDACTVEALTANLAKDDYTILKLLGDLTQADSFRLRVREN